MSLLSDARTTLYTALRAVFVEPVALPGGGTLQFSVDRVHAVPPQTVAAPCVWIEQPRGGLRLTGGGARVDVATYPVVVVCDGADRAQVVALDELVARAWDAARSVGDPQAWEPRPLDVGGPTLRATFVDVDMRIGASTLCGPTLMAKELVHA